MAAKKKQKKEKKWMQKAFNPETKGALHRELGVPEDEPIPAGKLQPKAGDSTRTKRRKALARIGKKVSKKKR